MAVEFKREKRTSLLNGLPEVVFDCNQGDHFRIVATSEGVQIKGESPFFSGHASMQPFAKAIGKAMEDHHQLARSLTGKLRGEL